MKTCRECKEEKPVGEFHKAKVNKDGRENRCKVCKKKASQTPEAKEARRARSYKYVLKHFYGMTLEEYDDMLNSQGGRCAICQTDTPGASGRFHVDHNHTTGAVRGLLCNGCNVALGHFKDSPSNCLEAYRYLKERGSYGES